MLKNSYLFICLPVFCLAISGLNYASVKSITDVQQLKINKFIELAAQETPYSKSALRSIFHNINLHPWIIETMQKPAEQKMTWSRYKKIF